MSYGLESSCGVCTHRNHSVCMTTTIWMNQLFRLPESCCIPEPLTTVLLNIKVEQRDALRVMEMAFRVPVQPIVSTTLVHGLI